MKKTAKTLNVFKTNKRIKLGIWGLGRGMSFFSTCRALNIDVVAGCDFNEHMRKNFLANNPGAFVTADAEQFLAQDFDAVLLATFCPAHADDAIRCLKAGKHVLSEVTAFHTMAEGVRLTEAVERSGLVYNLAENYPFSAANMYLARRWKEGLFGDLMYAEYEYVHECRNLCYTYIDGVPIQPGNQVHNWRSWLNFHYYCTHSLGPVMVITGTRPTRVTALPSDVTLAGYLMKNTEGMGGITPTLIHMSNGGLVRNLMGATTNDSHIQRLWGTLGSAEVNVGNPLQLRLGARGYSPKFVVVPHWDAMGTMAAKTGHGGGDFWVLYYFARQILTGEPGPFDIYGASDVTIPGILGFRSSCEDGKPYDVPDFRDPKAREAWRHDEWAQKRYDAKKGAFPAGADYEITKHFSRTMNDLTSLATVYRAYADWGKVLDDMAEPSKYLELVETLLGEFDRLMATYAMARKIVDAYPESDGARVLRQMLEVGEERVVMAPGFRRQVERRQVALRRKFHASSEWIAAAKASPLVADRGGIRAAGLPGGKVDWQPVPYTASARLLDIRQMHGGKDGLVYIQATVRRKTAKRGRLWFGADGPVKVWVNRKAVACEPGATNPAVIDQYQCPVSWRKGVNEVLFALRSNHGNAWGVIARADFA